MGSPHNVLIGVHHIIQVAQVGVQLPGQVLSDALEICGNRIMADLLQRRRGYP